MICFRPSSEINYSNDRDFPDTDKSIAGSRSLDEQMYMNFSVDNGAGDLDSSMDDGPHFDTSGFMIPPPPPPPRKRQAPLPPIPPRKQQGDGVIPPPIPLRRPPSRDKEGEVEGGGGDAAPVAPVRTKRGHRKHLSDPLVDSALYANTEREENIYTDLPDSSESRQHEDVVNAGQGDVLLPPPSPPPKRHGAPSTHLKQLIERRQRSESTHNRSASLPNAIPPPPPPPPLPPPPPTVPTPTPTSSSSQSQSTTPKKLQQQQSFPDLPVADILAQRSKLRKTGPMPKKPPRKGRKPRTKKVSFRIAQMREKLERDGIMNAYKAHLQREVSSDEGVISGRMKLLSGIREGDGRAKGLSDMDGSACEPILGQEQGAFHYWGTITI